MIQTKKCPICLRYVEEEAWLLHIELRHRWSVTWESSGKVGLTRENSNL